MRSTPFTSAEDAAVARLNVRAEMRAVEDNRRCRLDPEGRRFVVKSEDGSTRHHLRAEGRDGLLVVLCSCPAGSDQETGEPRPPRPGIVPCRHAARVARSLERRRLARFDGVRWRVSARAQALADRT